MREQLLRLARHSAVYGLGGIVSRLLAVLLLPLYTSYLTPGDYGRVETLIALTAVIVTFVRGAISTAFFRFWFDGDDEASRLRVLRSSFWFTMVAGTICLVAGVLLARPLARVLFEDPGSATLVALAFVGLWAQMNYEQLTAVFRVEERSGAFLLATLANVLVTVAATVVLVVGLGLRAEGVVAGNFVGTLTVYAALIGRRRDQLGLSVDRDLLVRMHRFGLPLVPSAFALWALTFSDRFLLVELADETEVGLYSIGVRVASGLVLVLTAFRMAWPAFAYSIRDDEEARRVYAYVLTYLMLLASWLALALGLLAPWLVRLLTTPAFQPAEDVVAPLAFAGVAFAGYVVLSIGVGRARRTGLNWTITGAAAAVDVLLNLVLIPPFGMLGAAASMVVAFTVLFLGMAARAQRVFPVPYQWARVGALVAAAVALCVLGRALDVTLPVAAALVAAYPLALAPLGFYEPAERRRLGQVRARLSRAVPRTRRA
jgi:O-antigen/teichoic acid export membrane protein